MIETTRDLVVLNRRARIEGPRLTGYDEYRFHVEPHTAEVRAYLTYEGDPLFLSLYSPEGYRGTAMNPKADGRVTLDASCAPDHASPGIVAGEIPSGEWRILVDHGPSIAWADYRLVVHCATAGTVDGDGSDPGGSAPERVVRSGLDIPEAHRLHQRAGWYRGELHAHTSESDGACSPAEVAAAAEAADLDFISLTDHHTISGWNHMRRRLGERTLLIRGCEITSRRGHANVHGAGLPLDPSVDRAATDGAAWTMNEVADAAHEAGGLFCVNHPFAGDLAWQWWEFDWNKADGIEILHALEGTGNNQQLSLWDHLLLSGYRVVGVAGTDSHHPTEPPHRLGALVSWVYCDELSERGVVDGIRRGRVVASYGPRVEFFAESQHTRAEMWQRVGLGTSVTLTVHVQHEEPVRVFVLKNGIPFSHDWLTPDAQGRASYTVTDRPARACYYRVELHGDFPGQYDEPPRKRLNQRDYRTLLAATNPVFAGSL
jgi:hypothetical protein